MILLQSRTISFPYKLCVTEKGTYAGGARASLEFGGSEKGRSLISAYWSLAIAMNTPGFKKLFTALNLEIPYSIMVSLSIPFNKLPSVRP